jgi:hypothetical protein
MQCITTTTDTHTKQDKTMPLSTLCLIALEQLGRVWVLDAEGTRLGYIFKYARQYHVCMVDEYGTKGPAHRTDQVGASIAIYNWLEE